jgi:hypothetical protein
MWTFFFFFSSSVVCNRVRGWRGFVSAALAFSLKGVGMTCGLVQHKGRQLFFTYDLKLQFEMPCSKFSIIQGLSLFITKRGYLCQSCGMFGFVQKSTPFRPSCGD